MLVRNKAKELICCLLVIITYMLATSYRAGPAGRIGDRTGSPMSGGLICNSCHTPGNFTPVATLQLLDPNHNPATHYTPGIQYYIRLSMSSATGITSNTKYGFQMTAVQASTNEPVNAWGPPPRNIHVPVINGREYVEHTFQLPYNVIDMPWTAPPSNTGDITFYCAANIVNGDFSVGGDNSVAITLTISPTGISSCIPPVLSAIAKDVKCKGDSTGAITLMVNGGTLPHRYMWLGRQGYRSSAQHLTALAADTFTAVVTTTGGCSAKAEIIIKEPRTGIAVQTNTNSPVCAGDSLGMTGTAQGGNGGLYYTWLNPQGAAYFHDRFHILHAGEANTGKYQLRVTDDSNCVVQTEVNAIVYGLPHADSLIQINMGNGYDSFYATGAGYITAQLWDFGDGQTDTSAAPVHTYSSREPHIVQLFITGFCGKDTLSKTIRPSLSLPGKAEPTTGISFYPNPAKDKLYIHTGVQQKARIQIWHTQGLQATVPAINPDTVLDISKLQPGLYLLHILNDDGQAQTFRFIKQ